MVFAKFAFLSCAECLSLSRLRDTDTTHFDEDDVACPSLGATLHVEDLDVWERDAFVDMVGFRDRLVCGSRSSSDPSSLCTILWVNHRRGYKKRLRSNFERSWHGHRRR